MGKQTDWTLNALNDIAVERNHQVDRGFDSAHDAQHVQGEIAVAAGLIAAGTAEGFELTSPGGSWMDDLAAKVAAHYGDDRRYRLVIAGAMIVAEIERLDRAERLAGN